MNLYGVYSQSRNEWCDGEGSFELGGGFFTQHRGIAVLTLERILKKYDIDNSDYIVGRLNDDGYPSDPDHPYIKCGVFVPAYDSDGD